MGRIMNGERAGMRYLHIQVWLPENDVAWCAQVLPREPVHSDFQYNHRIVGKRWTVTGHSDQPFTREEIIGIASAIITGKGVREICVNLAE